MIEIDCDFAGGNILVDAIEGDTVHLRPDLRDTKGKWFYWYFRARGASGRTVRFVFEEDVVGVRGPAVSLDGSRTWTWLGRDSADDRSFTYLFPPDSAEVRFSFGMPYTQANLDAFLAAHAGSRHLRADTLCESRSGRRVECLSLGQIGGQPEHRVVIASRHHACEMMANYALEGLMEAVLGEDDCGRWLRGQVEFLVVPFVDKDGVEQGDQGKNRRPHDHGRDYAAPCLYPEVQALRERVRDWAAGRLRIALDFHCPWIRGDLNERIYFVGMPDQETWSRVGRFSTLLEGVRKGPLPYSRNNDLPFGEAWNKEAEPPGTEPRMFTQWMGALPGVWFGVTLELPYANAQGAVVNAESARAFGRDLAAAMQLHLAAES
jgi:hypothetical protein